MIVGFLIIGITFVQVLLLLMENYLFGCEDEHPLFLKLKIVF